MQSLRLRTDRVREPAASAKSLPPFTGYAAAGAVVRAGGARRRAAGTLRPWLARALAGLGIVWFCGLAYLSDQQVRIWRDHESLWRSAGPECAPCRNNLGVILARRGYFELAKTEFERALALRPDRELYQRHLRLVNAILDARARGATPLRSSPRHP